MIGQTISHYRIIEKLGGGGMGVVYKAEDIGCAASSRSSSCPMKWPKTRKPGPLPARSQAASALNHPNICTIHEIGEQDGQPFIAMEFLDGMTLKHRIADRPLETETCCSLWPSRSPMPWTPPIPRHHPPRHQACEHLRDQARPRQDPRFRTGEGQPCGRSSSKIASATPDLLRSTHEHLTSPGSTLGTVAYMSPEQVRAKELDARIDLFSFGAVLYEMATGLPFRGESSAVIFEAILNRARPPRSG